MESQKCPYDGGECPQIMQNKTQIELLTQKIDLQQQHICDRMEDIASNVKEMKTFLNEKLDNKIDSRVSIAIDKLQAKMFRWCLGALLGSGGLSALITLLVK